MIEVVQLISCISLISSLNCTFLISRASTELRNVINMEIGNLLKEIGTTSGLSAQLKDLCTKYQFIERFTKDL